MKVLVVDDEPDMRELLTIGLGLHGIEAVCASDGQQAINIFKSAHTDGRPFPVVVLDLGLPGKDGFDVLKEIRGYEKEHEATRTWVITFSAYTADVSDTDLLQTSGGDMHVEKPDERQELVPAILKALEIVRVKES